MTKIEKYTRKAVRVELGEFCYLAGDYDVMEITEWEGGDGFDISVVGPHQEHTMPLTYGAFKALKKLVKKLQE